MAHYFKEPSKKENQKAHEEEPLLEGSLQASVGAGPSTKIEYCDGTQWHSLATESYVDSVNIRYCYAATTGPLNTTYSNGASGVGATLTNNTVGINLPIDSGWDSGIMLSGKYLFLVKDQANKSENGIYAVKTAGTSSTPWVLVRADTYDKASDIIPGGVVNVINGVMNAVTAWMQTASVSNVGPGYNIVFAKLAKGGVDTLTGKANQIKISGTLDAPVASFDDDVFFTGKAITLPGGTSNTRPTVSLKAGMLRFVTGV